MALHPVLEGTLEVLREQHAEMAKQVRGLDQAALDWKPGPDTSSLAILVFHTLGTERFSLSQAAARAELPARDRDAEFRVAGYDGETLARMVEQADAEAEAILGRVDAALLGEPFAARGREITAGWLIQYTLNHIGQHVGHMQLTRQLWDQRGE